MIEPEGSSAPPAPAPPPSPALLLIWLGRLVREEVESQLRTRGLSLRHLSALGHLSREPGLSYSELGRRAGITAQSMQATLRQLEDLGAVQRRTEPGRGRAARLQITDTGGELLALGEQAITAADHRLLSDIPTEQHSPLTTTLLTAFTAAHRRRRTPP